MNIKDVNGWGKIVENSQDPYEKGIIEFATRWANLMEAEMAKGSAVRDIADKMSHVADTEGITGFMYGCAVSILSNIWEFGEDLRVWHNIDVQIKDEGKKQTKAAVY